MKKTTKIVCPKCTGIQKHDIHDLTEGSTLDGKFEHACDTCNVLFTIEFQFVPYVKTY